MPSDRRPAIRAPEAAWRRLGELLQLRRADLGYQRRPAFTRDRDINIRLVTDIENAYRPDTFLTPTLRQVARAYAVTWDSFAGVLAGTAEKLEPAAPLTAGSGVTHLPPVTGRERRGGDYPYFTAIMNRLLDLAGHGITDPSGAQVFPDSDGDARTWDGIGSRLDRTDRAWLIADLQRRADGRDNGARSEPAPEEV